MAAAGYCGSCGGPVSPGTTFVTAAGNVCARCFEGLQRAADAARLAARPAEALQQSLSRRAGLVGFTHTVIWAATILLAGGAARLPNLWTETMLVVPAALLVGLGKRARWAYPVALALDVGGTLALAFLAATRSWSILLLALFPAFLAFLTWSLRGAFSRPAS